MSNITSKKMFRFKEISNPAYYRSVGIMSMLALLCPMASVQAQQSEQSGNDIEEVVVLGTRGALRQALDVKRNASSVVDAISAEDIGKFPDKNLAESLQRIAGVTINRGFAGEGNEVSIRGVNPELTQTLLNGQFVASTEWFSQGANNRSFNMDLLPSELVSSIEVHKSPTASQDEGGVGGTVVVNTRKPLDATEDLTLFASVETNTNSLADTDKTGVGATGYVSWKNANSTFGVSGLVHTNEIVGRADKAENYWEESWSAVGVAELRQNRTRETFDITLDFAPAENQSYTLQYMRNELDATNINQNNLVINSTDVIPSTSRVSPTSANRPLAGRVTGAAGLAQDFNVRSPKLVSDVIHFTGLFEGDGWHTSYQVGKTTAEGGNGGNANGYAGYGTLLPGSGTTVDFNADLPDRLFVNNNSSTYNYTDPGLQKLIGGNYGETLLDDEETYAQIDFTFDVQWGAVTSIETGIKRREHEQGQRLINADIALPQGTTLADYGFAGGTSHVSSDVCSGNACDFVRIDGDAYHDFVQGIITNRTELTDAFGIVQEDIFAAYVQANFENGNYRGNIGLRYVDTDVTGINSYGSDESNYTEVLPSANLIVDLSDDLILRTSAAKVMTRAGYAQLNPSYSGISRLQRVASQGNSKIEPFLANQFDVGLEWYFKEGSLLGFTVFHKDIESFITSRSEQRTINIPGASGLYTTNVPVQGLGGAITGMEAQFQYEFDNGFGMLANYTYVDGEGDLADGSTTELPGTSKNSYNLTGYYENESLSVRLAYTHRDEFLAEGTALGTTLDSFEGQDFVDASATWHINDNFDLTLEGVNLTDEITIQNFGSGLNSLRVANQNGTRYFLKLAYRL